MRGVVFDGERLQVTDELELREPGPGEAVVHVLASGICHSDLHVIDGASPAPVPIVLGHEAAGVVERADHGAFGPGDEVAVIAPVPCGRCRWCRSGRPARCPEAFARTAPPFRWRGAPVHRYANVSSFAERIVVRTSQLVATEGLEPGAAALLGCAVSTGSGAVRHVAEVVPGDTVVVFGIGGIGVNALQAARLAGAEQVVAVDVNPDKDEAARRFGAHRFVRVTAGQSPDQVAEAVRAACGRAPDAVIECSGHPVAVQASLALPTAGGTTALVGLAPPGSTLELDLHETVVARRRIQGSLNGALDPVVDPAALVAEARAGQLDLAGQVSQRFPLEAIEEAILAVRRGSVIRAVLEVSTR